MAFDASFSGRISPEDKEYIESLTSSGSEKMGDVMRKLVDAHKRSKTIGELPNQQRINQVELFSGRIIDQMIEAGKAHRDDLLKQDEITRQYKESISTLTLEVSALKKELSDRDNAIKVLKTEHTEQLKKIEADRATEKKILALKEKESEDSEKRIRRLDADLESATKQNNEKANKLLALQDLSAEYEKIKFQYDELNKTFEARLKSQKEAYEASIATLKAQHQEALAALKNDAADRRENLQSKVETYFQETVELRDKIEKYTQQIERLQQENSTLQR